MTFDNANVTTSQRIPWRRWLLPILACACAGSAAAAAFQPLPANGPAWARDISADGTTVIGEVGEDAFRYSSSTGLLLLPSVSDAGRRTAHGVSADGRVVVGGITLETGLEVPYRWTTTTGIEPLVSATAGHSGVALAVSADGGTIVGEWGRLPLRDDCGDSFCERLDDGNLQGFVWTQATGLNLPNGLPLVPGSQVTSVSGTGDRVAGNFIAWQRTCSANAGTPALCAGGRTLEDPLLLDVNAGVIVPSTLRQGDLITHLSADGSTLVGRNDARRAFRWRLDLGRQFVASTARSIARTSSADATLIGGDFGLWRDNVQVALKPLLTTLGFDVTGWDFGGAFAPSRSPSDPGFAPLNGGSGLTGISADGLAWAGTGVNPAGVSQPFLVTLDELPGTALLEGVPELIPDALLTATLPTFRNAVVGQPISVFAALANRFSTPLIGCRPILLDGTPVAFSWQATDPGTNAPVGDLGAALDIQGFGLQTLVLNFTPQAPFAAQPLDLRFDCGNTTPADAVPALNQIELAASTAQAPDLLSAASTLETPGVVQLRGAERTGVFTLASLNNGAAASSIVVVPFATVSGVTLTICESNPATAECLEPPAEAVTRSYDADQVRTYTLFVQSDRSIRPDFSTKRVLIEFRENESVRGRTSVALGDEFFL